MKLKLLALIFGLVALPAFGQATKMSTIMANYTNYNIPIVADATKEINSITALSGVEGNVDLTPTNRQLVLILVEPRLMNNFTGTKYQLTDLQERLKRFKRDLLNDGRYGLVLSASVYSGPVHQDGLTCMALRRFFKDVNANYTLQGVIFVGRFPECSELRRVIWTYGCGQVRDLTTNTIVQDFSNDGALLCVNSGIEAPRTDIPMADLDGNWESLYRSSATVEVCFIKPNNIDTSKHPWTEWGQTSFTVTGTKFTFQPGINPTYTDVFYVNDAAYSTPTINNGTISVTVTTTPPSPEVSAAERSRPSPMAMPDILISHINPYGVAIQEDPNWRDINGKALYDASGVPQFVASAPPAKTFSQDLERTLLVEYFDNNHLFRSGYFYNQPFNFGSAANALGSAAGTSALLANARPDWWQENDAVEYPTAGTTMLNAVADWFNQNVPVRYIMTHANAQANGFTEPDYNTMLTSAGDPHIWIPTKNVWVPSWTSNGGTAGLDFYRSLWKNKKISAATSPSLVFNGGCEAATPVGDNGGTTNSYINYGSGQVSESMVFYGKVVGTIARARIFYDQLEGWQNYTRNDPIAMFGEIWYENFVALSAMPRLWDADRSASKRAYWWNVFGDYTLRLRYTPCDGAQGGGAGFQGTAFGLMPSWAAGSEYCMATDGDINTYFDYSQGNGAYTGLDFGAAKVVGTIRYYPRAGWGARMTGGKFQGSNTSSSSGFVDLYTIPGAPSEQWNTVVISNSTAYRWVRYLSPDGGFANIAEMEFSDPQYLINAQAGANGSISPSGTIWVKSGASQTYTITPNSGYMVNNVKVDGVDWGTVNTYTFSNVTADHSITVSFKLLQYTIYSSPGSNGSISPSGTILVNPGASQTFTIAPNSGYMIADVNVDGTSMGAITTYTYSNVNADHKINATFKTAAQYTITASAGSNGSISPIGSVKVNSGANQTFTITPNSGYVVENVTTDGLGWGAITSYTFTNVTASHTISATFISATTQTPYNGMHGITSGSTLQLEDFDNGGEGVAYHDNDATNSGGAYRTNVGVDIENGTTGVTNVGWTNAGEWMEYTCNVDPRTYNITLYAASPNTATQTVKLYQDNTLKATFTVPNTGGWQNYQAITVNGVALAGGSGSVLKLESTTGGYNLDKLTFATGATQYTITASAGTGGSISPSGSVLVNSGASQSFTISANSGYAVTSVTIDGVNQGAFSSYTFNNVTANHTIAVAFIGVPVMYAITASAGANGSISPSGTVLVNSGSSQTFSITPNSGYAVSAITVDGVNKGVINTYTFTNVTTTHTISAAFTPATGQYTITASAGANGTISPSGSVKVNSGASQAFTITPNSGYLVSALTVDGSNKGALTTYTFTNVTAAHTISATFAPQVTTYEAENAALSGSAAKNTNHTGYSGTGFVDGYYNSTTGKVTFTVNVPTAGSYKVTLRYSAGNGANTNTGLYVNSTTKLKNITCATTTNWNTWGNEQETLTLNAGNNTIAYKAETSSGSCINLDYLTVSK